MSMTDPIADYLTRIRNAQSAQKNWVDIPASNLKKRISFVLKEEKFIRDFILIQDKKQDVLRVFLNYDYDKIEIPIPFNTRGRLSDATYLLQPGLLYR